MKKGKLLALALAGAITFMGAGYAAWQDNVNINATVSTAKFDVDISDVYSYVEFRKDGKWLIENRVNQRKDSNVHENNEYGIEIKRNLEDDNKKITYRFTNLFPDSKAVIHFNMTNKSSIPLIIKNFNLDVKDLDTSDGLKLEDIKNEMSMSYAFNVLNSKGEKVDEFYSETLPLNEAITKLEDLVNHTLEANYMIQANDNKNKTGIWLYLPQKAGDEFQGKSIEFDFNIEYAQFNDKPNK